MRCSGGKTTLPSGYYYVDRDDKEVIGSSLTEHKGAEGIKFWYKAGELNMEAPSCVGKAEAEITYCNTCCCREGLLGAQISYSLVQGTEKECGTWLSVSDNFMRVFWSVYRGVLAVDVMGNRCFSSAHVNNPNHWGQVNKKGQWETGQCSKWAGEPFNSACEQCAQPRQGRT